MSECDKLFPLLALEPLPYECSALESTQRITEIEHLRAQRAQDLKKVVALCRDISSTYAAGLIWTIKRMLNEEEQNG